MKDMCSKRLAAVCLSLLLQVASAEVFHDGDTVVFFGDSITHAGFYHEYIADYYLTRFPDASIRFVNSGVGGDNAAAATNRVEVDVAEYRPTHVALHFGMNDVGRGSYSATPSAHQLEAIETAQEKFRRNFPALVGKVKEAVPEAKAIYLTPTPYDDTAVPTNIPPGTTGWATKNNKGCNTGLSLLAGYILVSAKRDGVFAVDWFTPLNNFLMRRRSDDPHFMVTNWDRVHPGALGHAIMAWQFLISQGAPAVVSDVCVDAAKGIVARSDNATVSDVKVADDSVSFTVHAKSLPFPVPPEAAEAIDEFKVEERLNRETLAVEGLREGDYTLLIDGEEVGAWSAAELARGIRLGFNAKTPQYRQARAVFDRNAELSARERTFRDYHASRWFYGKRAPVDDMEAFGKWYEENVKDKKMYYAQFVPGYLKYWPTHKEARAKLWADQEAVRTLAKPVPRRYEIRQSCWPVVLPEKYARDPGAGFALVFVTDLAEPTAALQAFADDYQDAVLVCAKGADGASIRLYGFDSNFPNRRVDHPEHFHVMLDAGDATGREGACPAPPRFAGRMARLVRGTGRWRRYCLSQESDGGMAGDRLRVGHGRYRGRRDGLCLSQRCRRNLGASACRLLPRHRAACPLFRL